MKLSLLCALCACSVHSCITLTAELGLPGSAQSGGLSGKIGGSCSWPPAAKEPEPELPGLRDAVEVLSAPTGKNPVLPPP